jgi:hypothetical protein
MYKMIGVERDIVIARVTISPSTSTSISRAEMLNNAILSSTRCSCFGKSPQSGPCEVCHKVELKKACENSVE